MAHLMNLICLSIYLSALLKSASNVHTFEADLYIWGWFSLSVYIFISICTFEADFLCLSIYLSISICTFEADFLSDWPQMYRYCSLIGLDRSHEKINYFCLKCMEFCTFEADSEMGLKCTAVWLANSVCQPIR